MDTNKTMTNKQKYRLFCEEEIGIPIFSKDWWLDSVCEKDNWDVVLVEKGGQIMASMPYCLKKKFGFTKIFMPQLTQTLGPFIKYPQGQKYYKKLSWEKEMMTSLITQLPKFAMFSQNFHYSVSNWLPFYWKGFEQTTRYTYIIKNILLDDLEKKFETDIRRRRKKAKKASIKIIESNNIKDFYNLNEKTFARKGQKIPYSFNFINNLYLTCKKNNACKIYFAQNIDKNFIAASFLVWDDKTVYYLMGGIDPEKKDLGGMDVVLYESIKFAVENKKVFDFEGSMIESIEKYFRSFGAIQKSYFSISKTNSKILKTRFLLKNILT